MGTGGTIFTVILAVFYITGVVVSWLAVRRRALMGGSSVDGFDVMLVLTLGLNYLTEVTAINDTPNVRDFNEIFFKIDREWFDD